MKDARAEPRVEAHFESLAQQAQAARLGMWTFLGSETLLFAGLFALYVVYRVEHPIGFALATHHNTWALASVNTGVLLTSSFFVAGAVHATRRGRRWTSLGLVLLTVVFGAVFIAIKLTEYGKHFDEGIYPGGVGRFFAERSAESATDDVHGMMLFFTLYYAMTALHAIHVVVGMTILLYLAWRVLTKRVTAAHAHPIELGAAYWHLVDLVWIFLWPLFYLIPGGGAR